MIRNRPLTCLLLLATAVLNLALISAPTQGELNVQGGFSLGFLWGQAGCAAIWAVSGRTHRLARAAWLLAILAVLAHLLVLADPSPAGWKSWLEFLSSYSAFVIAAIGIYRMSVSWRGRNRGEPRSLNALRFPVVEIFGWTIVVSIACLVSRRFEFAWTERPSDLIGYSIWAGIVVFAWSLLRKNPFDRLVLRLIGVALTTFLLVGTAVQYDILQMHLQASVSPICSCKATCRPDRSGPSACHSSRQISDRSVWSISNLIGAE